MHNISYFFYLYIHTTSVPLTLMISLSMHLAADVDHRTFDSKQASEWVYSRQRVNVAAAASAALHGFFPSSFIYFLLSLHLAAAASLWAPRR